MNCIDYIIVGVILILAALDIVYLIRKRKSGCGGCCGACSECNKCKKAKR